MNKNIKDRIIKLASRLKTSSIESNFGVDRYTLLNIIKDDIKRILDENYIAEDEFYLQDLKFYGSYIKNTNKEGSDLDVIVQYKGEMPEDSAFNLFHEEELSFTDVNGNRVQIDINPININKSGTIEENLKYFDTLEESAQENEGRQEYFRFRLQTKDECEKLKTLDRLSNIKEKQGYYYVTFLAKTNSAGELAEYLRANKLYPVDLLGVTDYTKESA